MFVFSKFVLARSQKLYMIKTKLLWSKDIRLTMYRMSGFFRVSQNFRKWGKRVAFFIWASHFFAILKLSYRNHTE